MLWMFEDLVCAAFLDDLAEIHEDDVVGDAERLAKGMGNHHDAVVFLQLCEELLHLLAADWVEGRGALVGKQVAWFYGKTAGEAETLLLTTAQLGSRTLQAVFYFLPETYGSQVVLHDRVELLLVADAMDAATVSHIVVDAHWERAWALRYETDVAAQL